MDRIEELKWIRQELNDLYANWYAAQRCNDKRRRNKMIREACAAISSYAKTLPSDVLGLFDAKVALDALCFQFAGDDIGRCIKVLDEEIKNLGNSNNDE